MDNIPVLSVVMPVHNAEKYLKEAINSILQQTYSNFEFIIIDDASSDTSLNIINSYNDRRIKLFVNEKKLGVAKTLNIGIKNAKGKYIARMDADDISSIYRFETQLTFLKKHSKVDLVCSHVQLIDSKGNKLDNWQDDIQSQTMKEMYQHLPKGNCIAHPSVIIRTRVIKKYYYKDKYWAGEDYGLWLELCSNRHKIAKINKFLLFYRIHSESVTQKSNAQLGSQKKLIKIRLLFLWSNIIYFKINIFNLKVLKYTLQDMEDLYFKESLTKYMEKVRMFFHLFAYLFSRKRLIFLFKLITQFRRATLFFFFPTYCVGGAEKVHIDIINCFSKESPLLFFTNPHGHGNGFQEYFPKKTFFDIQTFVRNDTYRRITLKLISIIINYTPNAIVLGSNTVFFYNLISYLNPHVKNIDLIHAFGGGIEDHAISIVDKLDIRITETPQLYQDIKTQYTQHNIPVELLKRITMIPIYVDKKFAKRKTPHQTLQILYVGRDSEEKRLCLIGEIAKKCSEQKLDIHFNFIGNITSLKSQYQKYCSFAGEITNTKELYSLYQKSDILLLLSTREGYSIVTTEAMLNGVIPITTNVGNIKDRVQQYYNGFLIDKIMNEEYIMQKAIEHIITLYKNRELLCQMSENAYQTAHSNSYDFEDFQNKWRTIVLSS